MTGIMLLCCKRDEHLLPLAHRSIRRLGDWPVIVANDAGYPADVGPMPSIPYRRHHPKGWSGGVVDGLNLALDALPQCTHLFKMDVDAIPFDSSLIDAAETLDGRGLARGKCRGWYGMGYLLSRRAIRWLAAQDIAGDIEDLVISRKILAQFPVSTETAPGAWGMKIDAPIPADAKMIHFGQFPDDRDRRKAEAGMREFLLTLPPVGP